MQIKQKPNGGGNTIATNNEYERLTDQDTEGSDIKGLVINFIHDFWPSLFKMDGFLNQFITPLLKVTKGHQTISFFTVQDYKIWMENMEDAKRPVWL